MFCRKKLLLIMIIKSFFSCKIFLKHLTTFIQDFKNSLHFSLCSLSLHCILSCTMYWSDVHAVSAAWYNFSVKKHVPHLYMELRQNEYVNKLQCEVAHSITINCACNFSKLFVLKISAKLHIQYTVMYEYKRWTCSNISKWKYLCVQIWYNSITQCTHVSNLKTERQKFIILEVEQKQAAVSVTYSTFIYFSY